MRWPFFIHTVYFWCTHVRCTMVIVLLWRAICRDTNTHTPSVSDDDQQFIISRKGSGYNGTSKTGMALSYQAKKNYADGLI